MAEIEPSGTIEKEEYLGFMKWREAKVAAKDRAALKVKKNRRYMSIYYMMLHAVHCNIKQQQTNLWQASDTWSDTLYLTSMILISVSLSLTS